MENPLLHTQRNIGWVHFVSTKSVIEFSFGRKVSLVKDYFIKKEQQLFCSLIIGKYVQITGMVIEDV